MVATVNPASVSGFIQPSLHPSREQREAPDAAARSAPLDTVHVNDAALAWRAAQENVRQSLADIDLTLAVGREAARLAGQIGEAAGAGDADAVKSLLAELDAAVKAGVAGGAAALTGAGVRVQIEADTPPFEIDGLDLRLKETPGDVLRLSAQSGADPVTVSAAQDSVARIQTGLDRLRVAAQRLETHANFLATAESAITSGLRTDLNAESARLLALQVRQGLSKSGAAIANANPDSVLSLFRA